MAPGAAAPLQGMIEFDESRVVFRTKDDPVGGGGGRSHDGEMLITGAVECVEGRKAERVRPAAFPDFAAPTLKEFEAANTVEGAKLN